MKVKQWKYFWNWAFALTFLFFFLCAFLVYLQPKIYEGRALAQPVEIYPGEDLTPPPLPDGVTLRKIEGTDLIEVTARDADPYVAATLPNDYVRDWFHGRPTKRQSDLFALQEKQGPDSAEWRRLEIERQTVPKGGVVHVRAEISAEPASPDVDQFLGRGLQLSGAIALVIAFFFTHWRGEREGDGVAITPSQIGQCFKKVALTLCVIFVGISLAIFLQQPRAYESSATIEFLPHDPETFQTQLEILESRAPLKAVVGKGDLLRTMAVSTESDAIDELLVGLEIEGDPAKSTAEIRFQARDRELAELVPGGIAQAFTYTRPEIEGAKRVRRREGLELVLDRTPADSPFAIELKAELAKLTASGGDDRGGQIIAIGLPKKLPKDWLGWIRFDASIEIVRGCLWGILLTFVSLLYLTRFGDRKKVPKEVFTPWEPEKASSVAQQPNPDPY